MNRLRRLRSRRRGAVELNMAPLIDMVFILLIFFVVTASFVREAGIDVERPAARTAQPTATPVLQVGVGPDGTAYVEGRQVDTRAVGARVRAFLDDAREGTVMVVADGRSRTRDVITVIDQCRLAGAVNVSLAARQPAEP
ncbi:MAG: ExbD/TolR family protein [Desulfovibrionaceae bacterium]